YSINRLASGGRIAPLALAESQQEVEFRTEIIMEGWERPVDKERETLLKYRDSRIILLAGRVFLCKSEAGKTRAAGINISRQIIDKPFQFLLTPPRPPVLRVRKSQHIDEIVGVPLV